jgi:hypothetical protein
MEDLQQKIKDLERQNKFLEDKLRLYEMPSAARAFYVGNKLLNQQIDYLDGFKFKDEITITRKDDKTYDRSMEVYEKLSKNAAALHELSLQLGLTKDEKKDTERRPFVDTIAESRN